MTDDTKAQKVRHVKLAAQNRDHHCHWPGCGKQVKPALWGCYQHWMMLPKRLRDKIWETYRSGQEDTMTPSVAYIAVAKETQAWIKARYTE